MYSNNAHTFDNKLDKSLIFCSRGFNSIANPVTISTRPTEPTPITSTTPFTKIGSIDVNIKNFDNPKILLSISNLINTTITQNSAITGSEINIEVIFRIRTVECNLVHPISPEYIYSNPLPLLAPSPVLPIGENIIEVLSNPFEILYCNLINCNCEECITYIIEYSATLSATILGLEAGTSPILSLSSSISNVSMNALVSETFC